MEALEWWAEDADLSHALTEAICASLDRHLALIGQLLTVLEGRSPQAQAPHVPALVTPIDTSTPARPPKERRHKETDQALIQRAMQGEPAITIGEIYERACAGGYAKARRHLVSQLVQLTYAKGQPVQRVQRGWYALNEEAHGPHLPGH